MSKALAIALTLAGLAGCGVRVSDPDVRSGDGGVGDDVDAPDGTPIIDAPVIPACANGRVVYLNFEGQPLTRGTPSNATTNTASWMQIASGSAPPYHQGQGMRDAEITAITDGVRAQLADFPIAVVTVRPMSGPFVMVVYGGQQAAVGSQYSLAVNTLDCSDQAKSDVIWIGDGVGATQRVVNFTVGAIGFGLGLTATTTPTDCMCGWDNACNSDNTVACTLGSPIARDPAANQTCAGLTTQDERAAFATTFCQ